LVNLESVEKITEKKDEGSRRRRIKKSSCPGLGNSVILSIRRGGGERYDVNIERGKRKATTQKRECGHSTECRWERWTKIFTQKGPEHRKRERKGV